MKHKKIVFFIAIILIASVTTGGFLLRKTFIAADELIRPMYLYMELHTMTQKCKDTLSSEAFEPYKNMAFQLCVHQNWDDSDIDKGWVEKILRVPSCTLPIKPCGTLDKWKSPFVVERGIWTSSESEQSKESWLIISGGPDQIMNTADDIVFAFPQVFDQFENIEQDGIKAIDKDNPFIQYAVYAGFPFSEKAKSYLEASSDPDAQP